MDTDSGATSFGGNFTATECPICLNIFDNCRVPLATPCGHTLCRLCSISLAQQSTPFVCPLCRETISGLQQLKLNVALRDLIHQVKAVSLRRTRSQPCGSPAFPSVDLDSVVLDELLDTGAFGEVHRGRWRNGVVAVKVIRAKDMTPQAVETFYREVEVMNCLRHPNVVILLAACTTTPKLGIVMEYVGGGSLYRLLHVRQRKLTDRQVKDIALDVTHGMQYLHSINIMHRDMKSKNVLLTDSKPAVAKLCDFGLSRVRLETATMTGNIGTAQWTAPEILNESRYTFKADLYSFGVVLVEMVSNKMPFAGMHPLAIVMAVGMKKKKPAIPKDVHPSLAQLINCCLEWGPKDRASLAAVMSMLNEFDAGDSDQLDLTEKVAIELYHQPSFDSLMRSSNDEQMKDSHVDANKSMDPSHLEQGSLQHQTSELYGGYDGWTTLTEEGIDLQLAADHALALQLQTEEQQANTAGDSELARQLYHIEGAKANCGMASVDVEGGEHIPFHPNGVFLGELRDVIKDKQAKQIVHHEMNGHEAVKSPHNESIEETKEDARVVASAYADVAPALSSLIRSPSKSKSFNSHLPLSEPLEAEKYHGKPYLSSVRLFDHNELKQVQVKVKNTLPSWESVALEQMCNQVAAHHATHHALKRHERHISDSFVPSQSHSNSFERSDSGYESREAPARLQQTCDNSREGDVSPRPNCKVGSAVQKVFDSLKSVPTALRESVPPSWKEAIQASWREKKSMWPSLGRRPNWRPLFGGRTDQHYPSSPSLSRCPLGTNGYFTSTQPSVTDLGGTGTLV